MQQKITDLVHCYHAAAMAGQIEVTSLLSTTITTYQGRAIDQMTE
jgi:hypothetical protein